MIANLCLSNKPVVSSRALYDVQHTHSTFRDAGILLSRKDNQRYYADKRSVFPV